jgi:hypothetical protein
LKKQTKNILKLEKELVMNIKELINLLQVLESDNEIVVEVKIRKAAKETEKSQTKEAPKHSNKPQTSAETPAKEENKKSSYKSFKDLPAGVKAEKRDNRYIAVDEVEGSGAVYENRQILKNEFGFSWNSNEKVWEKIIQKG